MYIKFYPNFHFSGKQIALDKVEAQFWPLSRLECNVEVTLYIILTWCFVFQDPEASYDFNDNDKDPFPRYDITNENKWVSIVTLITLFRNLLQPTG